MKRHMVFCTLALMALCASTILAADVSGKWIAQVPGRQGQAMETTFTFKVAGDKLTGMVSMQYGDQDISDGKVSGDDIAFVTVVDFGGNTVKIIYKGKIAGSEIKFTREMQGAPDGGAPRPPVEFTAKRAGA